MKSLVQAEGRGMDPSAVEAPEQGGDGAPQRTTTGSSGTFSVAAVWWGANVIPSVPPSDMARGSSPPRRGRPPGRILSKGPLSPAWPALPLSPALTAPGLPLTTLRRHWPNLHDAIPLGTLWAQRLGT